MVVELVRLCCVRNERNWKISLELKDIDLTRFVITYSNIRGNRIKFPQKFTDSWGSRIDDLVLLKTKDGKEWFIFVEWRNRNIWLGQGWPDFRNNYQFQLFDTLLFKYEGGYKFTVLIFDGTGLLYGWEDRHPYDKPVPFFKQIVSKNYADKIVIPDEFTLVYDNHIENPLTLIGPDGLNWKVVWARVDSSIWFTQGWANFAQHYNIHKRDFLFFKPRDADKMLVRVVHTNSGMIESFSRLGPHDNIDEDNKVRKLWSMKLTEAAAKRSLALYVPAYIVHTMLQHKPDYIPVILPSGEQEEWKLI